MASDEERPTVQGILNAWLKDNDATYAMLAERSDVPRLFINRVCIGPRLPRVGARMPKGKTPKTADAYRKLAVAVGYDPEAFLKIVREEQARTPRRIRKPAPSAPASLTVEACIQFLGETALRGKLTEPHRKSLARILAAAQA